ncbi:hypothetical protein GH714_002451 [Hevea brasiliensis]|uniref:F-box associated beta-propeller type 1 domain-containing protein n=1 Tax=Hevea brasiliensis TaxID=3981 RepID=A0A6A6L000_HEVBR|nr:hypothetical protein GH714_002451 [Hevea brasiliensis]
MQMRFQDLSLGFGFDSATDDYKLVRIVYLPDSNFNFDKIPPLVEIYTLRSRGWRKVHNDLKYVITDFSTSAFLNGTCHWVATNPPNGPVYAMRLCRFLWEKRCLGNGVWMMKEYGVPGSWTNLFNISHLEGIRRLVAFRQSGDVLLANIAGELVFYDPKTEEFSYTQILGIASSFYLDTLAESLVLLDEANEFAEEEASEDDDSNGVSKEHSFSPDGVDKDLQKNSKGNKNVNSLTILNEANEILEEVASSSNSQTVIDEANEEA